MAAYLEDSITTSSEGDVPKHMAVSVCTAENEAAAGSDMLPEKPCLVCEKNKRHSAAIDYCQDCTIFLCKNCLVLHSTMYYGHKVVDIAYAPNSFPTEKCSIHPTELIDTYCGNHDEVCCHQCKDKHHRSCVALEPLQKAAEGITAKYKHQEMTTDLQSAIENMTKAIIRMEDDKKTFLAEKEDIVGEIDKHYDKVVEALAEWKKNILADVESREHSVLEEKKLGICGFDTNIDVVRKCLKAIENSGDNECKLFCHIKQGQKMINQSSVIIALTEQSRKEIHLKMISRLPEVAGKVKHLGQLTEHNEEKKQLLKPNCVVDIDVRIVNDTARCHISDICQLSNGEFLVADYRNKTVKRLDDMYKVTGHLKLSGGPRSLCEINPGKVAVTVDTKPPQIALINVQHNNILINSFIVANGEVQGLMQFGGLLYVCECSYGLFYKRCYISVYNLQGSVVQRIETDRNKMNIFTNAVNLTVDDQGELIYIADTEKGILVLDQLGTLFSTIHCGKDLKKTRGLCRGPNGAIFVAGYESNSVCQLTRTGLELTLGNDKKLKKPLAVCFDMLKERLLVAGEGSDFISVYQM